MFSDFQSFFFLAYGDILQFILVIMALVIVLVTVLVVFDRAFSL